LGCANGRTQQRRFLLGFASLPFRRVSVRPMISRRPLVIASASGMLVLSALAILDISMILGGRMFSLRTLLFPPEISFDPCAPPPPPLSFASAVVWLLTFLLGGRVAVVTYLAIGVLYTLLAAWKQPITIRDAVIDSIIAAVVASIGSGLIQAGLLANLIAYFNEGLSESSFRTSLIFGLISMWIRVILGGILSALGGVFTAIPMRRRWRPAAEAALDDIDPAG
jgi:hypothetical protein